MSRQVHASIGLLLVVLMSACGSGPAKVPSPVEEEFHRLESAARNAHSRGELSYAAELYQDLLTEAERTDDASKVGDTCYNLAVCRIALGEWVAARELLLLAEHELSRSGQPLAQVFLARARLELFAQDPGACRMAAEAAVADRASRANSRELAEAHVLLGLCSLEQSDVASAEAAFVRAKSASLDPEALPSILRLGARIAFAQEDWPKAAQGYDREADQNRALSRYDAMALALEFAGDAWLAAGELERAQDRFLRAARGRFAQALRRDSPPRLALAQLKSATRICTKLDAPQALGGDPTFRARLNNLLDRMEAERLRLERFVSDAERAAGKGTGAPTANKP